MSDHYSRRSKRKEIQDFGHSGGLDSAESLRLQRILKWPQLHSICSTCLSLSVVSCHRVEFTSYRRVAFNASPEEPLNSFNQGVSVVEMLLTQLNFKIGKQTVTQLKLTIDCMTAVRACSTK